MIPSAIIPISESTEVSEARRQAQSMATRIGFDDAAVGRLSIVVTEAARNIHVHAQRGEIVLRALDIGGVGGMEMLALDRGHGIRDIACSFRDGFSTAGTSGVGLGAISRQANELDVFSTEGGTVLLARLWANNTVPARPYDVGVICVAKPGEDASGDGWAFEVREGRPRVLVVDGLGHGTGAADASMQAIRLFHARVETPPAALQSIHDGLRVTRGAVAAVAELSPDAKTLRYAGIGNIVSVVIDGESRSNLVSMNGTLGHQLRRVQEFTYPWSERSLLLMHSDGLGTQWRLERYPGLVAKDPAIIAAVLYRDFWRGRDDVTVLALRPRSATA